MKSAALEPTRLEFDAEGIPVSPIYRDRYHPHAGALAQARHVFLAGNGLPERWRQRDRFVVIETGFGLGNNFLATWLAWREDRRRPQRLCFISVERHPVQRADLARLPRDPALAELGDALAAAWPPLTPNLHRLSFDDGRVELLLAFGDVQVWLPELVARFDAAMLDGFAPDRNARMWEAPVCKALARLAAPDATLATWTAASALRDGLQTAGFDTQLVPGSGGKPDITLARHAPSFMPRKAPPGREASRSTTRRALIVGAGLAGCGAAWALAEQGWRSCVLDAGPQPACGASGNAAGLFHGTVHADDGTHARFNRAAALQAQQVVADAIEHHGVRGAVQGLLRLETGAVSLAAMQARLAALRLPADYVQALDAAQATALAGLPLSVPAWFYPGGGWVEPAGLAGHFLVRAGSQAVLRLNCHVERLQAHAGGWQLFDAAGQQIDEAETVVLANAADALRLLGHPDWPVMQMRGQISWLPQARRHGLALPRVPVSGAGYLLPGIDGSALFGATAQPGDPDGSVRESDHRHNLGQLQRLTGASFTIDPEQLQGRTQWRCVSADRLPIVGAVPLEGLVGQATTLGAVLPSGPPAPHSRLDQPRFVPRQPGLYVCTGYGSRGIGWSALAARLLAAWITGAPAPLEASLIDAVDPARFVSRAVRRASSAR